MAVPDVFSPAKRSDVMSRIRARGNKDTEMVLARILRRFRIRGWRRHYGVVGCPDFAFPRERVAVFVDGCFWHGCPLHSQMPRSNRPFWSVKLAANKMRDRRVNRSLRSRGWSVLRIWEHDLRREEHCVRRIDAALIGRGR